MGRIELGWYKYLNQYRYTDSAAAQSRRCVRLFLGKLQSKGERYRRADCGVIAGVWKDSTVVARTRQQ